MKNIFISCLLFIVMITGILFSKSYLDKSCYSLIEKNNNLEKAIVEEHWKEGYDLSVDILNVWKEENKKLSIFVHHQEIDNINGELLQLTQYIKCKDKAEALAKIHVVKFYLEHISELERINIQNIF